MKNVFVVVVLISIGTATTLSAEYCVNYSSNLQSFMRQHGDYRTNACFSSQSQCESWANSMRSDSTHQYDLSGSCYASGQNNSSSGGYSGQNTWQNQVIQSVVSSFVQGLLQGLENQQREAEKKAKEEKWKKEEEERRKKEKEQQQAAFINSQANALNLLANRPGSGTSFFGSPPTNTMGSNFEPIGSGKYDASPMKQIERLMCSTYFAQEALMAVKNHQDEKARYLNAQGDQVMMGGKYQEKCEIPPIPQPPEPTLARAEDDAEAMKKMETITVAIQKDIKELQTIEIKLQENKKKMDETQLEKEKIETKIKEIQTKPAETLTSEEKEKQDTLIREAMALEEEINMMNKSYEKDVEEKSKIEGSLQEKSRQLQESQSKTLPSERKDEKK